MVNGSWCCTGVCATQKVHHTGLPDCWFVATGCTPASKRGRKKKDLRVHLSWTGIFLFHRFGAVCICSILFVWSRRCAEVRPATYDGTLFSCLLHVDLTRVFNRRPIMVVGNNNTRETTRNTREAIKNPLGGLLISLSISFPLSVSLVVIVIGS